MPRRKGVRWRPFFEARAFVHALGLKNKNEWRAYSRSGQRPDDIPGSPEEHYAAEWRGTGDWLGTGTVATKDREYRAFAEARAFVRALGLKNQHEWYTYSRSDQRPDDINRCRANR